MSYELLNKGITYRIVDHQEKPVKSDCRAVNGTTLRFRFAGTGAPVVLLHAIPKMGYHWQHLLPLLSDQSPSLCRTCVGSAEYVRCYSLPGGIRSMLAAYRAMLVNGEQNRESAKTQLALPVLALGGDAFIGARNAAMMQQLATNVTRHVFHAGHDLAEEVPAEMVAVLRPLLAA